jgi:hypothetical protein
MAKKRGESTASFKLRQKQRQKHSLFLRSFKKPKKGLSGLELKMNEIATLASSHLANLGADTFLFLLRQRKYTPGFKKLYGRKKKRANAIVKLAPSVEIFNRQVADINEWLVKIGRPDLRLTVQEAIEMMIA